MPSMPSIPSMLVQHHLVDKFIFPKAPSKKKGVSAVEKKGLKKKGLVKVERGRSMMPLLWGVRPSCGAFKRAAVGCLLLGGFAGVTTAGFHGTNSAVRVVALEGSAQPGSCTARRLCLLSRATVVFNSSVSMRRFAKPDASNS